jgi:putative membrane protein
LLSLAIEDAIMNLKQKFTDEDLQRIKNAVKEAEDKISGEIVPVIVERSGSYALASYKGSIIFGLCAFALMIILDRYVIDASDTLYYDPVFIFFVVVVTGVIGALLTSAWVPLKRMLIGQKTMDECTRQKAETAFLEEEVFNTRHRTGIMIFISFFEREVIVIADRGISKVVDQKEWDKLVSELIGSIRQEKVVEGIEQSLRRCGQILLEKGFHKTADDVNELRDDLRIN